MSRSLVDIFSVRAFPCLAVVGYNRFCSRSMSLTLRFVSSVGLIPVSRLICSFVAIFLPELAIIISSFSFVGIFIVCCSGLYFGICHKIL